MGWLTLLAIRDGLIGGLANPVGNKGLQDRLGCSKTSYKSPHESGGEILSYLLYATGHREHLVCFASKR